MTTTPPNSPEAERAVVGALLQDPTYLTATQVALPPGKLWFYDLRYQTVYDCLSKMHDAGAAIDLVTVAQRLKDNGQLESVGGMGELASLADAVPSAANVAHYAPIVRDRYVARGLIRLCTEVGGRTATSPNETEKLIEELRAGVDRLTEGAESKLVGPPVAAQRMVDDLERRFNLQGKITGCPTGYAELDRMTDGLQFGEQTIIAARPSIGKTALGLNIAKNACFSGVPTLFVSLESPIESLMRRLLAADKEISMGALRAGRLTEFEFKTVIGFATKVRASSLYFLQSVGGIGISQLTAQVRSVIRQRNIRLVVIDYLTKVRPDERHEKRTYEVAEVSGRLKALAESTNVALLTLAQLSRENEKDKGRSPKLTDLADSGQIERDADCVILLHRDRAEADGDATLNVAKQRDGETGNVILRWHGRYCRFEDKANET